MYSFIALLVGMSVGVSNMAQQIEWMLDSCRQVSYQTFLFPL